MIKRKDKSRKAKYVQDEERLEYESVQNLGKNILLLVEGETEETYFEGIKKNSWFNPNLAGVNIKIVGNLGKAKEEAEKEKNKYAQVWIVSDNDKRNAFVLETNNVSFFENLTAEHLPIEILNKLKSVYNTDNHKYFLSIFDYLQWLKTAITPEEIVDNWDILQHFTPEKKYEFISFDKKYIQIKHEKIHLAYSCIAFEFWLILHFEQNSTPFMWVEKSKNKSIDVFEYFKNIITDYAKGTTLKEQPDRTTKKIGCTAYESLLDDYKKTSQTRDDEWNVILRLITAYKNTKWLQGEMKPILKRQNYKWYEVNPYIYGMESLIAELINLKETEDVIDYFGLELKFSFNLENKVIKLDIENQEHDSFIINQTHQGCFVIKDIQNEYLPIIKETLFLSGNKLGKIRLSYTFEIVENSTLILIFKDPRQRSKSSQLLILLS